MLKDVPAAGAAGAGAAGVGEELVVVAGAAGAGAAGVWADVVLAVLGGLRLGGRALWP